MITELLIKIWRKQGSNDEQVIARAKALGEELPKSFYDNIAKPEILDRLRGDSPRNSKDVRTPSKNPPKSFRQSPDVVEILKEIGEGHRSKFINSAIRIYWKEYNKDD